MRFHQTIQKYIRLFLTISCLFPIFLIACSSEIPDKENLASVSFTVGFGSKVLSFSESRSGYVYRYKIVNSTQLTQFTEKEEKAWDSFVPVNGGGKIVNLKSGSYILYINVYQDDLKIYSGYTQVALKPGENANITVVLERTSGAKLYGNLNFSFSASCNSVSVKYKKLPEGTEQTFSLTGTFKAQKEVLEGEYEIQIIGFSNGIQCGGQTLAVSIAPEATVTITGSLETSVIAANTTNIKNTSSITLEGPETMVFACPTNGTVSDYNWYLDNVLVSQDSTYSYTNTSGGEHTIKCVCANQQYSCITKTRVVLTRWDVLDCLAESSGIYSDIVADGKSLLYLNLYPMVIENAPFAKLTSLSELGAEAIPLELDEINETEVIIVGKNANLTSSAECGWFGNRISSPFDYEIYIIFSYKNPDPYSMAGLAYLGEVHLGKTVTSIGDYSFVYTQMGGISRIAFEPGIGNVTYNESKLFKL